MNQTNRDQVLEILAGVFALEDKAKMQARIRVIRRRNIRNRMLMRIALSTIFIAPIILLINVGLYDPGGIPSSDNIVSTETTRNPTIAENSQVQPRVSTKTKPVYAALDKKTTLLPYELKKGNDSLVNYVNLIRKDSIISNPHEDTLNQVVAYSEKPIRSEAKQVYDENEEEQERYEKSDVYRSLVADDITNAKLSPFIKAEKENKARENYQQNKQQGNEPI